MEYKKGSHSGQKKVFERKKCTNQRQNQFLISQIRRRERGEKYWQTYFLENNQKIWRKISRVHQNQVVADFCKKNIENQIMEYLTGNGFGKLISDNSNRSGAYVSN